MTITERGTLILSSHNLRTISADLKAGRGIEFTDAELAFVLNDHASTITALATNSVNLLDPLKAVLRQWEEGLRNGSNKPVEEYLKERDPIGLEILLAARKAIKDAEAA